MASTRMKTRCFLDTNMKRCAGELTSPGWWFLAGADCMIRVRRAGNRFFATLFATRTLRAGLPDVAGRAVVGDYRTVDEARKAAELLAAMEDCPRVATWKDVVKVRRELGKASVTADTTDDVSPAASRGPVRPNAGEGRRG